MNFQVYVLCDIKMATQKGSQVARSKDELSLKFLLIIQFLLYKKY